MRCSSSAIKSLVVQVEPFWYELCIVLFWKGKKVFLSPNSWVATVWTEAGCTIIIMRLVNRCWAVKCVHVFCLLVPLCLHSQLNWSLTRASKDRKEFIKDLSEEEPTGKLLICECFKLIFQFQYLYNKLQQVFLTSDFFSTFIFLLEVSGEISRYNV